MKQIVRLALDLLKDEAVASVRGDVFAVVPSSLVRRLNRPNLANRLMSTAMAVILDAPASVRRMALRRVGHLINLADEPSAEQMDALLEFTVPVYHPTGSCTMGRANDVRAVVDPCCRVRGIGGLRVVDASIMPIIPSGNTCLPTMMVAEHAARLIVTPSSRLAVEGTSCLRIEHRRFTFGNAARSKSKFLRLRKSRSHGSQNFQINRTSSGGITACYI